MKIWPAVGLDGHHEEAGCGPWLARHFSPSVTEPIRLHVSAKRYLCAVEPKYLESLLASVTLKPGGAGGGNDDRRGCEVREQP